MLLFNYHSGFKQEMVATSLMISLGVFGSFLLLSQFGGQKHIQNNSKILGIQASDLEENIDTKISQTSTNNTFTNDPISENLSQNSSSENPNNTQATASATPKPTPTTLELPYGSSEEFNTSEFLLSFTKPRLVVTTSRVFKVDVVLGNKSINPGFENILYGTIVDSDDKIISPRVPLNLTEKKQINQGEQLTFSASLSIPETMKLSQISFDPKNDGNDTLYLLDPTL